MFAIENKQAKIPFLKLRFSPKWFCKHPFSSLFAVEAQILSLHWDLITCTLDSGHFILIAYRFVEKNSKETFPVRINVTDHIHAQNSMWNLSCVSELRTWVNNLQVIANHKNALLKLLCFPFPQIWPKWKVFREFMCTMYEGLGSMHTSVRDPFSYGIRHGIPHIHCDSMKYDLMLHWITICRIPYENASRTGVRILPIVINCTTITAATMYKNYRYDPFVYDWSSQRQLCYIRYVTTYIVIIIIKKHHPFAFKIMCNHNTATFQ